MHLVFSLILVLFLSWSSAKDGLTVSLRQDQIGRDDTLRLYVSEDIQVSGDKLHFPDEIRHVLIEPNNDRDKFLHDPIIIGHKKELIAAWYSCPEAEIVGESCIKARRSTDGGLTWSQPEIVVEDKEKKGIYYVPVQMLSIEGKLFAFIGKMTGHDRIINTSIYQYNEDTKDWKETGVAGDLFLPNTEPVKLKNGNWIIAGRVASSLGKLPLIPAVLISAGDRVEKEWKVVRLQKEEFAENQHPETTIIEKDNIIYSFTRVNGPDFKPVVYLSSDYGETWSRVDQHDFRSVSSKMYAGTLSDGRGYIVFNYPVPEMKGKGLKARSVLAIAISEDRFNPFLFSKIYKVQAMGNSRPFISHYPTAFERDGQLYVVYTAHFSDDEKRQCELAIIPLKSLKL